MPEQVQDFYPTPSTMSTVMYYTEIDPRDMKPVYVCKNPHEKAMQRALIQYRNPKNYDLVKEALLKAGREDLIGFDKKCLIRPRNMQGNNSYSNNNGNSGSKAKTKADVNKGKFAKDSAKKNSAVVSKDKQSTKAKKTIRNVHKKKQK